MPQFKHNTKMMTYVDGTQEVTVSVKAYVSSYLGWGYGGYWRSMGWALLFVAVLQIITFFAITFLTFMKR